MSGYVELVSITLVFRSASERKSDAFINIFDLIENRPLRICQSDIELKDHKAKLCHVVSEQPVHCLVFRNKSAAVNIDQDRLFSAVHSHKDIELMSGFVIINITYVFYLSDFFRETRQIELPHICLKGYIAGLFHYPVDHKPSPYQKLSRRSRRVSS